MKIIYINCGVKNYMKVDHCSYRCNFCSCKRKREKRFRLVHDLNPWPLRYRCSALPIELASQLGAGCWIGSLKTREKMMMKLWICENHKIRFSLWNFKNMGLAPSDLDLYSQAHISIFYFLVLNLLLLASSSSLLLLLLLLLSLL